MKQLSTLALTTMSLLLLGVVLLAGDAIAQQKSLKEQLVGTWIYVSSTSTRADGSKTDRPNLKGIVIYTSDGHFAFVSVHADLPKLANLIARGRPRKKPKPWWRDRSPTMAHTRSMR
jgi:hypothetical protein